MLTLRPVLCGLLCLAFGCGSDPASNGASASGTSGSSGESSEASTGSGLSDGSGTTGADGSTGSASGSTSTAADTTSGSSGGDTSGESSSGSSGGQQVDPSTWDCNFVETAIPGGSAGDMAIAFNDDQVLAVGFEGLEPRGLHQARFGHDGVSFGAPEVVQSAMAQQFNLTPRAAWNGSVWGVVYGTRSNISPGGQARFVVLDESGDIVAGPVTVGSGLFTEAQIVWVDDAFAMVWHDGPNNLWFGQVDDQAMATDLELLQNVSIRSNGVALVRAGNELGLAWTRSGDVEFQRLSLDGTPLTQPTAVLADALSPPELLWNGEGYMGVAVVEPDPDQRRVQLFELAPNGTPVGDPLDLMEAEHRENNNSVAAHSLGFADQGQELGVTYLAMRDGDVSPEVYFHRVGYDGELLGEELRVSAADAVYGSIEPWLLWTGNGYLAAWRGNKEPSGWDAWVRSVCPGG